MTAAQVLEALRARGVEVVAAGDRVRYRPPGAIPPELRAELVAHKAEVLRLLASAAEPSPGAVTRPDHAELARALALPLAHLDRVLRVAVPWLEVPLYFVPEATNAEELVAAGEARRGAVWTRRELLDVLAVPGLTRGQARTVALARLLFDGEVVDVRESGPAGASGEAGAP